MRTIEIDKDVVEVSRKFNKSKENLLPILQELVSKKSYLSEKIIRDLAYEMKISPNEIYSVASFYSFIKTKPTGKYAVKICQTISCDLAGKAELIKTIEKELGISCGETTEDKLFTLETTNCIGLCDKGPALLVNDDVYTKVDSKKAVELIKEYRSK